MNQKNTRYLEKKILESTDRLIESAIAASLLGDEAKEKEFRRGAELIGEIARNLKELIDVQDDYLPEILNQIISQKLPDTQVQKSLGTFTTELERIVQLGVLNLTANRVVTTDGEAQHPAAGKPEDNTPGAGTEQRVEEIAPVHAPNEVETGSPGGAIQAGVEDVLKEAAEEDLTGQVSNAEYQECEEPLTGPGLIEDAAGPFSPGEITPPEETEAVTTLAPAGSWQASSSPGKTAEEQVRSEEQFFDGILLEELLNGKNPRVSRSATPLNNSMAEQLEANPVRLWADAKDPGRTRVTRDIQSAKKAPAAPATKQSKERNLAFCLKLIFPGVELLHNVTIDGVVFTYYLPSKRLALDQVTSPEDRELKTKICQQEGIAYLIIEAEDGKNPRRVERILQRHKINTRA